MRSFAASFAVAAFLLPAAIGCGPTDPVSTPGPAQSPLGDRPDLPVDERISIDGLEGPVDVVRDKFGRPHIYATSVKDAMRVEGYLVAGDRTLELEFFRRVASGRVAEILSDTLISLIDLDITYRHIGLARQGKAQYASIPPGEIKDALDAYADGVTQVFRKIRSGDVKLPVGVVGIAPSAFTDWSGADSLTVGRLQSYLLSYDADGDLETQIFFDAARSTFSSTSADPLVAKRAGLERDLFRFAPADPTTTASGYPSVKPASAHVPAGFGLGKAAPAHHRRAAVAGLASGYLEAMRLTHKLFKGPGYGSNNWAISAARSATGHPLIASDPHLSLSAPSVFWPVSIDVTAAAGKDTSQNLKVGGVAFPGIPGIILGHNEHIAWGATVAGYDVSDAYAETLTADASGVVYQGKTVPLETIDEVINLQSGPPLTYHVKVVPHHGPILPTIVGHEIQPLDPTQGAISIRWTGADTTNEFGAVQRLLRATDVDAARAALTDFSVGAQNWMLGDTSGNILWTSHARVPRRDKRAYTWDPLTYQGTLPCFVLPGDGTAEWSGYLDDDLVPWEKNPSAGYIASANNDPIGESLDNDPSNGELPDGTSMYLACSWDLGFREGKIHARIEGQKTPFTTDDLSSIQGDVRSSMGAELAPALVFALERAEEERKTPGTHPDLTAVVKDPGYDPALIKIVHDSLVAWGMTGDYQAASGVDPTTNMPLPATGDTAAEVAAAQATLIFNAWMVRLQNRVFGDELARLKLSLDGQVISKGLLHVVKSDPATLATFDAATGDSSLWDDLDTPAVVESRNERMVRALLDALGELATLAGPDPAAWRWGAQHRVTFGALIPLFSTLSIPPSDDPTFPAGFPRHGDCYSVDASVYGFPDPGVPLDFTYAHGPAQRFVVDMDPAGPRAFNAIPGGNVWDRKSLHFSDEAELWRKNQTHPIPFLLADVIADKERRTLISPP
jgi:penicillin amidase